MYLIADIQWVLTKPVRTMAVHNSNKYNHRGIPLLFLLRPGPQTPDARAK